LSVSIRPIVVITEHDAWLRGRVGHERALARFVISADRPLRIRAAFALPHDRTVTRTDAHDSQSTQLPRES
jgi:hypothetical protein